MVLLILLSALNDPVQYRYHLTSSELGTDIDVMDDASECKQSPHSYISDLVYIGLDELIILHKKKCKFKMHQYDLSVVG